MARASGSGVGPDKPKKAGDRTKGLDQVRALSHPLRLQLLELFAERPLTTKQAAERLRQAPTRLYHHVAALENAGLIRLKETRPNRGTTEKYFETVVHKVQAKGNATIWRDKSARQDLAAAGIMLFDQARNDFVRALSKEIDPKCKAMVAIRGALELSERDAKHVANELLRVLTEARQLANASTSSRARANRQRYSLTIAMVPSSLPGGAEKE